MADIYVEGPLDSNITLTTGAKEFAAGTQNATVYGNAKWLHGRKELERHGLLLEETGVNLGMWVRGENFVLRSNWRLLVPPDDRRFRWLRSPRRLKPPPSAYAMKTIEEPVRYGEERHLITIAPSRSGKGTTAIIPTLLDYDASVLVIDPKGQNAAVTARRRREFGEVKVVNPFGLHTEAPWNLPQDSFNPLAAIDPTSENLVADVNGLCEALIINDGKDSHWSNSARDLVSAIILYLIMTPDEKATLPEMRRILTQPSKALNDTLTEMSNSPALFVAQRASRFLGDKSGEFSREVQSILSTALTQTSFLDDPAIAASLSGDDFRLADLKTKKLSVFVVLPSRYLVAYARWLRLFVVSAVDSMTSSPKGADNPVLFVLDEFASLGHLSAIENAMAIAAGYGVRLWPILQDVNQAKDIYAERWETFLANAGALQVFAPNDITSAEYFSKRCGTLLIHHAPPRVRYEDTSNSTFSRPLALPQELMGMQNDISILFLSGRSNPLLVDRLPYYLQKRFKGQYDPDPYHQ